MKDSKSNKPTKLDLSMSKNIEKKRSIPKRTSTDGLHKYFKLLNEVTNQLLVSLVTDRENIDHNETDRSSELSLPVSNSTLLVNNTGNLSLHDDQMPLCNLHTLKIFLLLTQIPLHPLNLIKIFFFFSIT